MAVTSLTAWAQFGAPRQNPTVPSVTENVVEDFKPATTNQENKQFPAVNSQRMVRAQISAPQATFVGLDIAGKIYQMTKDENGVWTGTSEPQDEGFHYYQLNIDGASVPDPGSKYYYGASRWGSGIDIPAQDEEFYTVKNVQCRGRCATAMFTCPTSTTRILRRSSPCFTYSMAWARTRQDGVHRVRRASLWII